MDSSGLYPKLNIDMFGKDYLCHMSRVRVRMVVLFCLSYSAFFSIRKVLRFLRFLSLRFLRFLSLRFLRFLSFRYLCVSSRDSFIFKMSHTHDSSTL